VSWAATQKVPYLVRQLGLLLRDQGLHLRQQCWVDVGAGKFVEQVHN